jgi:hypothetical protein
MRVGVFKRSGADSVIRTTGKRLPGGSPYSLELLLIRNAWTQASLSPNYSKIIQKTFDNSTKELCRFWVDYAFGVVIAEVPRANHWGENCYYRRRIMNARASSVANTLLLLGKPTVAPGTHLSAGNSSLQTRKLPAVVAKSAALDIGGAAR